MKVVFGKGSPARRAVMRLPRNRGLREAFPWLSPETPVQPKKPSGWLTPSGLLRLVGHAAMGVAMGLAFALILIIMDPSSIATLIDHGGSQPIRALVGTLVLTFAIGATLTGVVFMMMEDN